MTAVELLTAVSLPLDILWDVIAFLWHSSMSPRERIDFMILSHQVNKLWMNIFMRVAYTDVYITSRPHLDYYLKILRQESHIYKCYKGLPNILCKSITIQVKPPDQTAEVLADVLYMVKATATLPNVNTLVLRYPEIFCYWDIYRHQFIDLPSRIERLEVHLPWRRPDASQARAPVVPPDWYAPNPIWQLPQVRHLSIFGMQGHEIILWCFLVACPQLCTLETDFSIEDLKAKVHRLMKLPSRMLSSRLHHFLTY
jgi:hypothetical protein